MSTRLHTITHSDQNVYFQQACPLPEELLSWRFLINDDPTPLELTEPSSYIGVEPFLRLTLLRPVLATTISFPRGGDVGAGRRFSDVGRGAKQCGKQSAAGP